MAIPTSIPFHLENLTFTNLSLDIPTNITQVLVMLPSQAATQSGFWFTAISLIGLCIIQYFALAERSPFARFGYSDSRALSMCFALNAIFGIYGIELGFYTNFRPVAMLVLFFMLSAIYVRIFEDKE